MRLCWLAIGRIVIQTPLSHAKFIQPKSSIFFFQIYFNIFRPYWSQWPRVLRRRSTAARLLRLWVRMPPGAWMSVCCDCCVLSGIGLCDALITRPEESYRLWCVVVCDLETSRMRRPWPTLGRSATKKNISPIFCGLELVGRFLPQASVLRLLFVFIKVPMRTTHPPNLISLALATSVVFTKCTNF